MNYLFSLFSANKLAFYGIAAALTISAIGGISAYSYHKGVVNTENKLVLEYSKLLESKLKTNTDIMNREFAAKTENASNITKVKTVYVARKEKAKVSSDPNSIFNRKGCDFTDTDLKEINELTVKP